MCGLPDHKYLERAHAHQVVALLRSFLPSMGPSKRRQPCSAEFTGLWLGPCSGQRRSVCAPNPSQASFARILPRHRHPRHLPRCPCSLPFLFACLREGATEPRALHRCRSHCLLLLLLLLQLTQRRLCLLRNPLCCPNLFLRFCCGLPSMPPMAQCRKHGKGGWRDM